MDDLISRQAAIDALYHVNEYNGRSVEAIRKLPSAQPEIIRCKDCKYIDEHHYEENGEPPCIKYTCAYKAGLAKEYQVQEWDFCSRAERRQDATD